MKTALAHQIESMASSVSGDLARNIESLATSVRGQPSSAWPAWSTGEYLMVALVLNDHAALDACSYTMVEAFDRVDLDVATLRAIERRLQG